MNRQLIANYRENRRHQLDTYSRDNVWIDGERTHEHSGGGAVVGFHAVAAYNSARSHIHFMKRLKADISASEKRSRAAKRGWQNRRAAAA